jgi:hypothetical protein
MFVPCIIRRTRNNHHHAQICTTALFYTLAPTCFSSRLPSLGSFWICLSYMKIQINLVVYHIMLVKWPVAHRPLNLLAPKFGIENLAHPVCTMWIIQEPKRVALWNKWHFEEKKKTECAACLKNSVHIFVEKIYEKGCLDGSGVPVQYTGRTVPKG